MGTMGTGRGWVCLGGVGGRLVRAAALGGLVWLAGFAGVGVGPSVGELSAPCDGATLARLLEVGLGPEYGDGPEVLHRWEAEVRVGLGRAVPAEDEAELDRMLPSSTGC